MAATHNMEYRLYFIFNISTYGIPAKCKDHSWLKTASNEVDHLARQRFGNGFRMPNKIEAFGLIDELLETCDGSSQTASNNYRRNGSSYCRDGQRKAA